MKCYVLRTDDLALAVPISLRWTLIDEVELALLAHWRENPECQLTFDNVLLLQHCLKRFPVPADMQRGCQDYDLDAQLSCHLCHTQKRAWRRQWQSKWERQQCPLTVGLGWKAMSGQAPDNRVSSAVPTLQFPAGPHERAAVHTAGTHCNGKQVF